MHHPSFPFHLKKLGWLQQGIRNGSERDWNHIAEKKNTEARKKWGSLTTQIWKNPKDKRAEDINQSDGYKNEWVGCKLFSFCSIIFSVSTGLEGPKVWLQNKWDATSHLLFLSLVYDCLTPKPNLNFLLPNNSPGFFRGIGSSVRNWGNE